MKKYNLVVSGYWDICLDAETPEDAVNGRGRVIADTRDEVDWEVEEVIDQETGVIVWSKDEDRIGKNHEEA